MDVHGDLKYVYTWNYYAMKFMGIWPDERKWNRPSSYIVLMPFLVLLCSLCIPQMVNLPLIADDFDLVIENLSMGNITFTISILKISIFWIHGKPKFLGEQGFEVYSIWHFLPLQELKSLLKCMAHDWSTVTDVNEHRTMITIARMTKKIIRTSTMLSYTVVFTYLILRILSGQYNENTLLFRAYFPYDIGTSPNYELTLLAQFMGSAYAAAGYTAVDTFVAMLILHVCAQLMNLKDQLKRFQEYDKEDLETKLKEIVRKHVYLNRFMKTVEDCFNWMLLIQMFGCTIQLCFQCFQAIMSLDAVAREYLFYQMVFLFVYVVYVMLQLLLYCFVGEKLSIESAELASAAYDSKWYKLCPRNARLLTIIICRARLPLTITAGKLCSFTLVLYSQVLKTSMQYISVLYAMKSD